MAVGCRRPEPCARGTLVDSESLDRTESPGFGPAVALLPIAEATARSRRVAAGWRTLPGGRSRPAGRYASLAGRCPSWPVDAARGLGGLERRRRDARRGEGCRTHRHLGVRLGPRHHTVGLLPQRPSTRTPCAGASGANSDGDPGGWSTGAPANACTIRNGRSRSTAARTARSTAARLDSEPSIPTTTGVPAEPSSWPNPDWSISR